MDLNNIALFNMTTENIKYLSARQKQLATNVANANTPGYLPTDVERPNFDRELNKARSALRTTNEKHIATLPSQTSGYNVYTPKPTSVTLDGNGVILEEQLNEVSKNKSEHDRMFTIHGKYQNMLKIGNTKINS